MEFRDNEAIYIQIADYVGSHILQRNWQPEEKIPSVRELAVELQVNLNTVMHSYEYLENQGVIYNKRGIGFFIDPKAYEKMVAIRKERFIKLDLPQLFSSMQLLQIDPEEILTRYAQFRDKSQQGKRKKS